MSKIKQKIKVIKRIYKFKTPHFKILGETVINQTNNHVFEYYTLIRKNAIFIIPFDGENVYFIKQYRHPIKKVILELPAGGKNPKENSIECARREIIEETGIQAKNIKKIGFFYMSPSYSSQKVDVYLATNLTIGKKSPELTELITNLKCVPVTRLKRLIKENGVLSGPTLSSLYIFLSNVKK